MNSAIMDPSPPEGDGLHRYRFRLLALDCAELAIRTHPSCAEVEAEASRHVLAEAEITALYRRELA